MRPEEYNIPKEKLVFRQQSKDMHDQKLQTKPVGYFKDAWYRFRKNKASIVATIIIGILILFAIIVPFTSKYKVSYSDEPGYPTFSNVLPKSKIFSALGANFWDGCKNNEVNTSTFWKYKAIEAELGHEVIKNGKYEEVKNTQNSFSKNPNYKLRENSYYKQGAIYKQFTLEEYQKLQAYQDEYNIQVIYPYYANTSSTDSNEANFWYEREKKNGIQVPKLDAKGNFIPLYEKLVRKTTNSAGEVVEYTYNDYYTSKMRIEENGEKIYSYASAKQNDEMFEVRVDYYEYYIYYHKVIRQDKVKEPYFLFGTTSAGQDILTCLASGARFSLILAVVVATVNLVIGAIIGAIEGYYGGKVDMILERIIDILGSIPFMIVITLLKYHMDASQVLILFIAFFLTGWTGMAARTRMQFYRYKNQEYVLVARTLGARDRRIMFKHIFPNAIGTLITSCVLVIPGVIFSETSLSYLGIINLESGSMISVGTLLGKGNSTTLLNTPHVVLFPALFISLLELSFNLFGNGLRDAFNPSLRGTED